VTAKIATTAVALALLAPCAAAAAPVPPGFVGISPQSAPSAEDFDLMRQAGVGTVRLPLIWAHVEPANPRFRRPDWTAFDRGVQIAAEHGMRVFPFVWGTPPWLAYDMKVEPTARWQRRPWVRFLHRAVRRYGRGGVFWRRHPELTPRPVREWEIWNESNIVTFGNADPVRMATLLRISGRTIHRADPGAKTILGGLFGLPLQVPPNAYIGDYLSRIYAVRGVKRWIDGVALHPYVARAAAMRSQIRTLRRVLRRNGDAATKIYVTEIGWGSDGFESRWERGIRGQARELNRAFAMLANNRRGWRIGGVWWFSWADAEGPACQFCDSAGLLTRDREAKPAWYRFNAWTGGDPRTVPRAPLRTLRRGAD